MGGYDPAHFASLYAIEERHSWFRARRELIGHFAQELTRDLPDGYRVLEVGCGTGSVLRTLELSCPRGQVVGMDIHAEGLGYARTRTSCELVVGDANNPPFGKEFHLVGMFDVLEHLPDDVGVLHRMGELLLPGGTLLLTVPADPTLWSASDERADHVRRYTLDGLEATLTSAGFAVDYVTAFMRPLASALRAYRRLAPRIGRAGKSEVEYRVIPVVNEMIYRLLKLEQAAIRDRQRQEQGTSALAVARWPGS